MTIHPTYKIDLPGDSKTLCVIILVAFCSRHLSGIDFINLSYHIGQAGSLQLYLPKITRALDVPKPGFVAQEWIEAQKLSSVPVKACVPGPFSIISMLSIGWLHSLSRWDIIFSDQTLNEKVGFN